VITGLDPGDYPVLITDINGCMWTDTISIEASPGLMFDVPGLYMIDQGDSVLIAITGDITEPGLTFQWIPAMNLSCTNCPAALAYPSESTTYQIQITDEDSCVYNLVTNVVVTIDSNSFDQAYAPNVFSPNGDGINDVWTISSRLENTFVQDLAIFDRWGNMVFSKSEIILNTMDGWDGTREGKTINPGVFVYTARLVLGDGQEVILQGDITLVR
jgi:gliding motility-associated-like protein